MAEQYETMREVGIAIDGLKGQLTLYAKVFAGVVAVAGAAYAFAYNKIDNLEDATARIDERLTRVEADIGDMKRTLETIRANTELARADLTELRKAEIAPAPSPIGTPGTDAFAGWYGVPIKTNEDASNYLEKYKARITPDQPIWLFVKDGQ